MKKVLLLLAFVTVLISCNKAGKNEYIISGAIKGIEDGKSVTLEVQDDKGQLKTVATTKVKGGKFSFKGSAKEPEMHLIQVEKVEGKVPFILENGDIDMVINKDSIGITKVKGTYNNDELTNYKDAGMKIQKKMMKFQKDNTAKMTEAQQKKDTVVMNSLRKEYGKFQEEFAKQSEDYLKVHPKAFISTLIIEGMFNQMSPDVAKIKTYYAALDKTLQDTKPGKAIKTKIDQIEHPAPPAAPAAPVVGGAPEAAAGAPAAPVAPAGK